MRPFFTAFAGGFLGKVLASLFIAICVMLGVGPDTWGAYLLGTSSWLARGAFIILAMATFATVFGPLILERFRRPNMTLTEAYHLLAATAPLARFQAPLLSSLHSGAVQAWGRFVQAKSAWG